MLFCMKCCKFVGYKMVERLDEYIINGETVFIRVKVPICRDCGCELISPEVEDENLLRAYEEYSKRHGLVHGKELAGIRNHLNLTQEEFAKILGVSIETLKRYEMGSLIPKEISDKIKSFLNGSSGVKRL